MARAKVGVGCAYETDGPAWVPAQLFHNQGILLLREDHVDVRVMSLTSVIHTPCSLPIPHLKVYYNNVLSLPPLTLLVLLSGELRLLPSYPMWNNGEFQLVAVLGGLMGFMVSFASIWCMSRTSPTIYSLTGSLNKVWVKMLPLPRPKGCLLFPALRIPSCDAGGCSPCRHVVVQGAHQCGQLDEHCNGTHCGAPVCVCQGVDDVGTAA